MKQLNVIIVGTDDRGSASLPYHYNKLGHNVFMVKPGVQGLNWNKEVLWPRLLHKCASQPDKRNFQVHGYPTGDAVLFGEDRFIEYEHENLLPLYEPNASVELIDFDKQKVHIDAFHTTANCDGNALKMYFEFASKHFPNAKWISSSITHWDQNPGGFSPKNIVRMLPASYKDKLADKNACNFYRHRTEFDLVNINPDAQNERNGFGSFNHNFHVRHPEYYKQFCKMNVLLKHENLNVPNYGGNIRGHGADIKYNKENGITGNYETLNPRQSMQKYTTLKGVVIFKNCDWCGGVPSHCLISGTPYVCSREYVRNSGAEDVFIDDYNCILFNTSEEAATAVMKINADKTYAEKLSQGMRQTRDSLFSDDYWNSWEGMLNNLQ